MSEYGLHLQRATPLVFGVLFGAWIVEVQITFAYACSVAAFIFVVGTVIRIARHVAGGGRIRKHQLERRICRSQFKAAGGE